MDYKIDNILPDKIDDRDYLFLDQVNTGILPTKVDNRKYAREIENQLTTSSCVANATVSALELLAKKAGLDINLSRLFLYYNLREPYANLKEKDKGSYLRDGFKSVNQLGICTEDVWKFNVSKVNTKPDQNSYNKALENKVQEYKRIVGFSSLTGGDDYAIQSMKVALAKGYPITISMTLGKTFTFLKGALSTHNYIGVNNDSIGGHAMNVVGYDDSLQGFIVENSWGSNWGDNGFCLIKYDVIKKDCKDVWVCTKFKDLTIEEEIIIPTYETININTSSTEYNYYIKDDKVESQYIEIPYSISGGLEPIEVNINGLMSNLPTWITHEKINNLNGIIKVQIPEDLKSTYLIKINAKDSGLERQDVSKVITIKSKVYVEPKPIVPPTPIIEPKKKSKTKIYIGIGVAVLMSIGIGLYYYLG